MKKRKIVLAVAVFVVIFMLVAMGTTAYLMNQANGGKGVTNTFVWSGGGKLIDDPDPEDPRTETFSLYEHKLKKDAKGTYTLDTAVATSTSGNAGNAYEILPGVNVPKDPQIDIYHKTKAPAYLFVEVVDEGIQSNDLLSYALTEDWVKLDGVTGANGGDVYVYHQGGADDPTIVTDQTWEGGTITGLKILEDDQIVVADADTVTVLENAHLDFYAYLAQANAAADAAGVYTVCFGAAEEPEVTE